MAFTAQGAPARAATVPASEYRFLQQQLADVQTALAQLATLLAAAPSPIDGRSLAQLIQPQAHHLLDLKHGADAVLRRYTLKNPPTPEKGV